MLDAFCGKIPRSFTSSVSVDEITLAVCLRAHENNPWVIDRLRSLSNYYCPQPHFLIVDFGSAYEFQSTIEDVCTQEGMKYVFVEDFGTYSAARAHNEASPHVATDLICFMDIDFIGTPDLFAKLCESATAAGLPEVFDIIIDLPAYHMSKEATEGFEENRNNGFAKRFLQSLVISEHYTQFGKNVEFIAPYSNCFLITTRFFSLLGGYDERFRGHGSEDFEFFIRAAVLSGYFRLPEKLGGDFYGPTKDSFFSRKDYVGFRRLNELFAARAQRFGLQVFHRWHPTGRTGWRKQNDWKRARLKEALSRYERSPQRLLEADWLPRQKNALCVCKAPEHWAYFIMLRLYGYRVEAIYGDAPADIERISELIENGAIDVFAIFNPYMKSHAKFFTAFSRAKEKGLRTLVVERGALPNSVYYAEDVSYAAASFSQAALDSIRLNDDERQAARRAIQELRSGKHALESGDSKMRTDQRYASLRHLERQKVFVPLQLDDDMAVTKFVRDAQGYEGFVAGLRSAIAEHPETLFIVKPHPLSKLEVDALPENSIVAERTDNVHSLLDLVDAVVCYNSGVGFLAACHGTPLITVGNAFYNLDGVGEWAGSISEAVRKACADPVAPIEENVVELMGKYLFYRYSNLSADDDIKEVTRRRIHGYRNIRISRPVIFGEPKNLIWERTLRTFATRSFGFAEMNVSAGQQGVSSGLVEDRVVRKNVAFCLYAFLYGVVLTRAEKKRLQETPQDFFMKARHPLSRFGRYMFARSFSP